MMTMLRRGIAYAALALSVTVGGVIIGAAVIAPMVSPAATPANVTTPSVPAAPSAVSVMATRGSQWMQSVATATGRFAVNASHAVSAWVMSRRMPQLEPRIWLAIAVGSSLVVVSLVGWRYRSTRAASRVKGAPAFLMPTEKPMAGKPVASIVVAVANRKVGKVDRTPRAVMALAESGAGLSEIARRTGMPLDAVAMCLSMSTMGVRQLQPPTA